MPRKKRVQDAGIFLHVLNRANSKLQIFRKQIDYEEFIDLLIKSLEKYEIDVYAYIIMPTHWHIVCSAKIEGEISRWMAWLQMVHTFNWHKRHKTIGRGHFYQGRYKSFIIQEDVHFLQVCRYVEKNALRGGLVTKAENWEWSSLSNKNKVKMSKWPISKPEDYLRFLNENITCSEIESIRNSIQREKPFGDIIWIEKVVKEKNLEQTVKPIGRPKKGA